MNLAEVWCSECTDPAVREVDGRGYCVAHEKMAERVIDAHAHVPDREATVAGITGYLYVASGRSRKGSQSMAEAIYDMLFVPQLPSPETIEAARQAGILAD